MTRTTRIISVATIALAIVGGTGESTLYGSMIGINFASNEAAIAPTDSAGVVPQASWNNAPGKSSGESPLALLSSDGTPSALPLLGRGAPVTWRTGIDDAASPDHALMKGYLDTGNATTTTINVTGVPYSQYYVLTMYDGSNGTDWRTADYKIDTNSIEPITVTAEDNERTDFSGTYQHLNSNSEGNYVIHAMFDVGSDFTLTAKPANSGTTTKRAPINAMQIIDLGTEATRINLADICGGGDGSGTGTIGDKIMPAVDFTAEASSVFIDGTFTPKGDAVTPVDSDGNTFDFSAAEQASDGSWGGFGNGRVDLNATAHSRIRGIGNFEDAAGGRALMSAHASKGITFDLAAIRAANPGESLTHFTTIVGDSRVQGGGSNGYFILLDGVEAASRTGMTNTEEFVSLDIPSDARFLTLASVDNGDGNGSDHAYFGDPFIHTTVVVPEPTSLALLLFGVFGILASQRRQRR